MPETRAARPSRLLRCLLLLTVSTLIGWHAVTKTPQEARVASQTLLTTANDKAQEPLSDPLAVPLDATQPIALRSTDGSANAIETLEQRVAALEATLERQALSIRRLGERTAFVETVDPVDLDKVTADAIEYEEQCQKLEASHRAHDRIWETEGRFEDEAIDPPWSNSTMLEVNDAIAAARIKGAHEQPHLLHIATGRLAAVKQCTFRPT